MGRPEKVRRYGNANDCQILCSDISRSPSCENLRKKDYIGELRSQFPRTSRSFGSRACSVDVFPILQEDQSIFLEVVNCFLFVLEFLFLSLYSWIAFIRGSEILSEKGPNNQTTD